MTDEVGLLLDFLVALGIGAMIGLQREQSAKGVLPAGSRTFPLVALMGALTQAFAPALVPIGLAAVLILAALGYLARVRASSDPGLATSVATLLTFVYGLMTVLSDEARLFAVVFGAATTIILALETALHGLARRISTDDGRAILTFVAVALVVLPLLPDAPQPILLGLNPRFVWLMVAFVCGIDLVAFLAVKLFATRRGHLLAGVVGGLVSSTATTVSMANRTRRQPAMGDLYRLGIVVASLVMLVRMVAEVAVVAPVLLHRLLPPMLLMGGMMAMVLVWWLRKPMEDTLDGPTPRNPFRLTPALSLGVFLAAVLLATTWLHDRFGASGAYLAAVTGVVDVDAMTLAFGRLAADGAIPHSVAASATLLLVTVNFIFKLGLVAALGTGRLFRGVALALGSASVASLCFVVVWNL